MQKSLTDNELDTYSRQIVLADIGYKGNNAALVPLDQPSYYNGCIETPGICEYYFFWYFFIHWISWFIGFNYFRC